MSHRPRSPASLVTAILRLHATVLTAAYTRNLTLGELADAAANHPDGVKGLVDELLAAGIDVDALAGLIDEGLNHVAASQAD